MRTVETKVYTFDELSDVAKQNAINAYRDRGNDYQYIWDDAHESVKAFHNIFPTKEGRRSWLEIQFECDYDILELSGLRLRTYLINHYWTDLYKGKYIGNYHSDNEVVHKRIKSKFYPDGAHPDMKKYSNFYYSAIKRDDCCVLTGVCYDNDLLEPIYKFIDHYKENKKVNDTTTFEDLLKDCFYSLEKSINNEIEANESDEGITEYIQANDLEFTEDGTIY